VHQQIRRREPGLQPVPCRHESERPEQRSTCAARDAQQGRSRLGISSWRFSTAGGLVHRERLTWPAPRFNPRPCRADERIGGLAWPCVTRRSRGQTSSPDGAKLNPGPLTPPEISLRSSGLRPSLRLRPPSLPFPSSPTKKFPSPACRDRAGFRARHARPGPACAA
jgi:hypothetical protein